MFVDIHDEVTRVRSYKISWGDANVLRHVLLTSAALALTGCLTPPAGRESVPVFDAPFAWSAPTPDSGVPASGDWVAGFDDPTLNALVEEGFAINYNLAATAARLEQAFAIATQAGAGRFPSVDLNSRNTRTDSRPVDSGTFGLSLQASWEADVWRRVANQAKAGTLDAEAAFADLEGARLSLAGQIAQGWYDLVEARLNTALSEDEVATFERSLRLTQRRYDAGVAGALDVRLSRSSLALSEASLAQRRNFENGAARGLEVLLGRYPAALIESDPDLPTLAPLTGVGAPGDLLARRPDLRAAEARLESSGYRAKVARKALLPSLTLSASGAGANTKLENVLDVDGLVSTLTASLLQPIFRGGALRAEVRRSDGVVRERLYAFANQVLTAYREAEDALDAEIALAIQEEALGRAADEAREAESLAERNYTRGVGTIFELLDAQRRRINAERSLIGTRAERVANRIRLHLAIGGEFYVSAGPGAFAKESNS